MNFSLTITGGNEGADIKITNQRTEEGIFFADLMLSLATPVDLFPRTTHVETVTLITRTE